MKKNVTSAALKELDDGPTGFKEDIWSKMSELGWLGLAIPADYGGVGGDFMGMVVLLEEMGRACLPSPFLQTVVAGMVIAEFGSEELKKELLPKIASGEIKVAIALLEAEATIEPATIRTRATGSTDGYRISGTKLFVEMAQVADMFITVTRTGAGQGENGISLFLVDAKASGISIKPIPTIGMDRLCEVDFRDVSVPENRLLGIKNKGWAVSKRIMELGAIAKCTESVGGMQTSVDMTVDYSKQRVQYDKPIGINQALQHLMANMWISMQTSRYLVYEAAWLVSQGMPCEKEVSMSKAYVNEAYKQVGKWAVRLHGGIGTNREYDIPRFYRRAMEADSAFGGTDYHRSIVARKIGLK